MGGCGSVSTLDSVIILYIWYTAAWRVGWISWFSHSKQGKKIRYRNLAKAVASAARSGATQIKSLGLSGLNSLQIHEFLYSVGCGFFCVPFPFPNILRNIRRRAAWQERGWFPSSSSFFLDFSKTYCTSVTGRNKKSKLP